MVDVIISFDSEDFLTPEAADAELWWAQALRERGIRGSFQLVGEMVRSLIRSGRIDVIGAIAEHEIGYHSNFHSLPPTHPPAVDGMSLADAIAYIMKTEAGGVADVAAACSAWPISYCSPGDSWTPATLLAMARMGMHVFCNDRIRHPSGVPYWYCGMLIANYDEDFQDFYDDSVFIPGAFEKRFVELEAATPEDGVIILYTHPTRLVTADFWDVPFYGGVHDEISRCPTAPLRPAAEIERNKLRCRQWLDWLRQRAGLRFIDFATLYAERSVARRGIDALCAEHGLKPGGEGQLPIRQSSHGTFLPSASFAERKYSWKPYPADFVGSRLIEQGADLTWTAAPARRSLSHS